MKKFIIFLLPILFLFSCQKPDTPEDTNNNFKFEGVWKVTYNPDDIVSELVIDVDNETFDYTRKVNQISLHIKNRKGESIKGISFRNNELSYTFEGKEYRHKAEINEMNDRKMHITLRSNQYGVFSLLYEKLLSSEKDGHEITLERKK